jgi:hypothetical protein
LRTIRGIAIAAVGVLAIALGALDRLPWNATARAQASAVAMPHINQLW